MDLAILRAFLDDVKANPFDDTPRLILADWLEEHGATEADRARGTYIRSLGGWRDRACWTDADAHRRTELLVASAGDWTAQMKVHPKLSVQVEDGLLTVSGKADALLSRAVRAVAATPAWDWVETVELSGAATRRLAVLDRPLLERVGRLRFGGDTAPPAAFFPALLASPYLGRLNGLHLRGYELNAAHLTQLASWPQLARLRELQLHLSGAAVPAFADLPLPALHSLRLSVANATADAAEAALRSPHLSHVRHLYFFGRELRLEPLQRLHPGEQFRALEALDLGGDILGDAVAVLAGVEFSALRSLSLRRCWIAVEGACALARAPWLAGLGSLDLSINYLGAGGVELLAAPLPNLRRLNLSSASLPQDALVALTRNPQVQRLETLLLADNPLGQAGEALAASDALPALRVLDVNNNSFLGDGLRALARWPGLSRLEELNLSPGSRRDGLAALLASPHRNPRTRVTLAGEPLPEQRGSP